jgi:hypothetical protein
MSSFFAALCGPIIVRPMDHRLALALCIMCGVFGGVMLFAFCMAFSQLNVLCRSIQIARERKKSFVWWTFLGGLFADWEIWREIKGIRWLLPVGVILCVLSYAIHRAYLAQV